LFIFHLGWKNVFNKVGKFKVIKQKSRTSKTSDFLIETKPQEPLLAALFVELFR